MPDNYTPQSWADGQAGGTPITAARLTNMENGIDAVDAAVQGVDTRLTTAESDISALQSADTSHEGAAGAHQGRITALETHKAKYVFGIVEDPATPGSWGSDVPARTPKENLVILVGVTNPTDATNGVATPANLNIGDVWIGPEA